MKQYVISMQASNCYTEIFFLGDWYWTLIEILWLLVLMKTANTLLITTKISLLEKSYILFWWYLFRGEQNHFFWWFIYCFKYKNKLSDICSRIWGGVVYYLFRNPLQESENKYKTVKMILLYLIMFLRILEW